MREYLTTSIRLVLAVMLVLSACSDRSGPASSQPEVPAGATLLPTGRLVRPAGHAYDVGLFPSNLVVSPDGRIAVTANAGNTTGLSGGFGTLCDDVGRGN